MKLTLQEAERMMAENNGSLDIRYDTRYTELPEGLTVDGNLDISYTGLRELPEGLMVGGWLDAMGSKIKELPEGLIVGGLLDVRDSEIRKLPDNLTVGGGLYMNGTGITELPEGLMVGRDLYIEYTKIKKLPEGLIVDRDLNIRNTEIKELPEGLIVGGALDISDTEIKELPEGLMVGGWLDVRGSEIRKLPERLTVGGSLYMKGTEITELPESLVVGGYIYWDGKTCGSPTPLRQGDYAPGRYLFADGILTQISKKKTFGGYDVYIGKIKGRNVVSDGTYYAHCDKIRDGIEDLQFKEAKARRAEQYSGLPLDSELTPEEAITMYRVITGACRQGTQAFVDSLGKLKEHYSIREIIALTEGQYSANKFKRFFGQ